MQQNCIARTREGGEAVGERLGGAQGPKPGERVLDVAFVRASDRATVSLNILTRSPAFTLLIFGGPRAEAAGQDRDALAQVAQCLTTGPLKGRSVKLVGRADPRGTQEYNMALGARRSSSVMNYLVALGVPSTQMRETSRGALDATGSDQAAWQADRRVDVDILDAAP